MALILRERLGAHVGPRPIAGSGAPARNLAACFRA
jgi:hypothetical protein